VNPSSLDLLLRRFRRHMVGIRAARIVLILVVFPCAVASVTLPELLNRRGLFLLIAAGIALWIFLLAKSFQAARQVQTGSALLSIGQLNNAETWLRRAIEHFSLSTQSKIVACQHLAVLFFQRDAHQEVVLICRELLRSHIKGLRHIWVNVRLLLADSLLMLDKVAEAYEVILPVYNIPLNLADRMKLLPVRLRCELATDQTAGSVEELCEKVQIAELLDAPRAALVHALLAEACRRQSMPAQQAFLAERARLYHDLDRLVDRYPIIAPVAYSNYPPTPE